VVCCERHGWSRSNAARDLGLDPHLRWAWVDRNDGAQKTCGAQYTLARLLTLTDSGSEIWLLPLPALQQLRLPSAPGTASHESIDARSLLKAGRTISTVKGNVAHLQALLPCALASSASFFGVHLLTWKKATTLVG